jgi:hypothetical protein
MKMNIHAKPFVSKTDKEYKEKESQFVSDNKWLFTTSDVKLRELYPWIFPKQNLKRKLETIEESPKKMRRTYSYADVVRGTL